MFGIGVYVYMAATVQQVTLVFCVVAVLGGCTCVHHQYRVLFLHFSPISLADSPQNDDSILSQNVHGELVVLMSLVKSESEESFYLYRS